MSTSSSSGVDCIPVPYGPVPSPRQVRWHRREQYGFIHFTQNTFTGREWGFGDEDPVFFNPAALDCRQWWTPPRLADLRRSSLPPSITTDSASGRPRQHRTPWLPRLFGGQRRPRARVRGRLPRGRHRRRAVLFALDRNHEAYGSAAYVDVYHAQWRELLADYGRWWSCGSTGPTGATATTEAPARPRTIDPFTYYRF